MTEGAREGGRKTEQDEGLPWTWSSYKGAAFVVKYIISGSQ